MDRLAVPVGEDLDFDMARPLEEPLQDHPIVAEGRGGFPAGAFQRRGEVRVRVDPAHALAAAARRRLDQERSAQFRRGLFEGLRALRPAIVARQNRHAGPVHEHLGPVLAAHGPHGRRRRSDEDEARRRAGVCEVRVLGEETVAGMDRLGPAILCRGQNRIDVQIALGRGRRTDRLRFVGERDV